MLFALVGIGGTGKTTVARKIEKRLHVKYFHFYSKFIALSSIRPWISAIFWPMYYLSRLWLIERKAGKRITICDRYFYDKIQEMMNSKKCGVDEGKKLVKILPQPSITFWLDVAPEVSKYRKDEGSSIKFLDQQRKTYFQILQPNVKNLIKIDASKLMSEVFRVIEGFMKMECKQLRSKEETRALLSKTIQFVKDLSRKTGIPCHIFKTSLRELHNDVDVYVSYKDFESLKREFKRSVSYGVVFDTAPGKADCRSPFMLTIDLHAREREWK